MSSSLLSDQRRISRVWTELSILLDTLFDRIVEDGGGEDERRRRTRRLQCLYLLGTRPAFDSPACYRAFVVWKATGNLR